jgi:hypothetical protein
MSDACNGLYQAKFSSCSEHANKVYVESKKRILAGSEVDFEILEGYGRPRVHICSARGLCMSMGIHRCRLCK